MVAEAAWPMERLNFLPSGENALARQREPHVPIGEAHVCNLLLHDPKLDDPDGGGEYTREFHELLLQIDALHGELRHSEQENESLRLDIVHYRLSLEESERCANEREARAQEALSSAVTELRIQLDTEARARMKAEQALARLTIDTERIIKTAEWRAQCADQEAAMARKNARVLREQLEREVGRSWWRKLVDR